MARYAVIDWLDAERDEFIDKYLDEHPDATEFEAAMIWAFQLPYVIEQEQEMRRENV
jgi:hypothetical protein